MMRVLLLQLDGKLPNLALMRISAHCRAQGWEVKYRVALTPQEIAPRMFDPTPDLVFASAIFKSSAPLVAAVLRQYPGAATGGTGVSLSTTLSDVGIPEVIRPDYSCAPDFVPSLGFTSRGCARRCGFCVVPEKEGAPRSVATAADIWRGEPHPRRLLLLDNNFFSQPLWRERAEELVAGRFEVCLTQGIDLRALTEEQAEAMAAIRYRSLDFRSRRIYSAWDREKDGPQVERGISRLLAAGVPPRSIMVYTLIGFDDGGPADWARRTDRLLSLGCVPFPMPFVRNAQTLGFQRWISYGYHRTMTWEAWERDGYQAHAETRRRHEQTDSLPLGDA